MSKSEKENFKNQFKGYKRVTKTMLKTLKGYGLVVLCDGKHYKVYRTDNVGGSVTLAKTPSDYRSGLNVCAYLIKLIEA